MIDVLVEQYNLNCQPLPIVLAADHKERFYYVTSEAIHTTWNEETRTITMHNTLKDIPNVSPSMTFYYQGYPSYISFNPCFFAFSSAFSSCKALKEITIPENEPGSSIMPGKVNPTQCEALTMVAVKVMGNDASIGFAASQGNFELNVFMPVCAYNFLQSARLLAEAIRSFNKNCAVGIKANKEKMHHNLHNSLMLVTALNPYIGYENAAKTAKKAFEDNISLKEACVELGFLTPEGFDEIFHPEQMA